MRINNIGYLLKEGFKGIFIHGFMSFAAVCVTVACLLIVGSFYSVMHNVNHMVKDLNETNEVIVYVKMDTSEADALSVGSDISLLENIASSRFISKEEAWKTFVEKQDNPEDFDGVDASALQHRYSVILTDNGLLDQTRKELEQIPNVEEVRALLGSGVPDKCTAMQAIGYKEMVQAVRVTGDYKAGAEEIKLRSRQYAKRQLTWFKRNAAAKQIVWGSNPDLLWAVRRSTEFMEEFGI